MREHALKVLCNIVVSGIHYFTDPEEVLIEEELNYLQNQQMSLPINLRLRNTEFTIVVQQMQQPQELPLPTRFEWRQELLDPLHELTNSKFEDVITGVLLIVQEITQNVLRGEK